MCIRDRYIHDTEYNDVNAVPVNFLIGILTNSADGSYKYQESIWHSSMELLDEFVCGHNDLQAVKVQHDYPIPMMLEMDCNNPKCKSGYLKDKDGQSGKTLCGTCKGSGKLRRPSPFETLLIPSRRGVDSKGTMTPPYQFVKPPVESIASTVSYTHLTLPTICSV